MLEDDIPETDIERFYSKVEVDDSTGCWEWAAFRSPSGYGYFSMRGSRLRAHRVSWRIHHGEILFGLYVCHWCDNRGCVNPNHLFLGSASDNMRDCSDKGRHVSWCSRKTHCLRGHEFTVQNTRLYRGVRYCRECARTVYALQTKRWKREHSAKAKRAG